MIPHLRGHLHCRYSFIAALHNGLPFDPSIVCGIELEKMLDAAMRSVQSGEKVTL